MGSLVREPSGVIVYTYVYFSARSVRASLCARPALVEVLTSINRVFLHRFQMPENARYVKHSDFEYETHARQRGLILRRNNSQSTRASLAGNRLACIPCSTNTTQAATCTTRAGHTREPGVHTVQHQHHTSRNLHDARRPRAPVRTCAQAQCPSACGI